MIPFIIVQQNKLTLDLRVVASHHSHEIEAILDSCTRKENDHKNKYFVFKLVGEPKVPELDATFYPYESEDK